MTRVPQDRWTVTFSHVRSLLVAVIGLVIAVFARRPDVLVLVAPMVMVTIWAGMRRPVVRQPPGRRMTLAPGTLREGNWAPVRVQVTGLAGADTVAVSVAATPFVQHRPRHGTRVHIVPEHSDESVAVRIPLRVRPTRWGRHILGPTLVGATSAWGAFRWGPVLMPPAALTVLPAPDTFDAKAPAPRPRGLVGLHRSARPGEGNEFSSIRRFQWGDRLKRIHWARSLRTGDLHVTSSYADQDTHVAIIVDAHYDLGVSQGIDGSPSSLDQSVRAAGAVAEHFLHQGDRVSLQVLSQRTPVRVRSGTGRRHSHLILASLARIVPSPQEEIDPRRLRQGMSPGTLVVLISALVSPDALTSAAVLARSGLAVVVIDALVDDVQPPGEQDAIAPLAWSIRLLEREREMRRIQQAGVPVVPWIGPGSLDLVLRSLARRGHRGVG